MSETDILQLILKLNFDFAYDIHHEFWANSDASKLSRICGVSFKGSEEDEKFYLYLINTHHI